ncbi:MAG: DNA cytosine methyltransferase, partial [Chloroflexi bacterium]
MTGDKLSSVVTVTDMFCGAGGSSQGAFGDGVEVKMAMNHWKLAIETHNTNFPDVDHHQADVSQMDPRYYPSTTILWASPECTNHSVAKGKKRPSAQMSIFGEKEDPSAVRSRATMWDPVRWAEYHRYQTVIIENVVDVVKWRLFDAWLHAWRSLGYEYQIVYLNSMFAHLRPLPPSDAGQHRYAPQSRDRVYIVFWKKGNKRPNLDIRPRAHCHTCGVDVDAVQSWKNPRRKWGRYRFQYVYRCPSCANEVEPYRYAAFNAIDWSIPAQKIGERKRPLKERTLQRIKAGIEKYGRSMIVIGEDGSIRQSDADYALVNPLVANALFEQTGSQRRVVYPPAAMVYLRGTNSPKPIDTPLDTLAASGLHHALIVPGAFLSAYYSSGNTNVPLSEATGAITTRDRYSLVVPPSFWIPYANGDGRPHGVDEPFGTQHTSNAFGLATIQGEPDVNECGFRMLEPHEIGAAMAFGADYIVLG